MFINHAILDYITNCPQYPFFHRSMGVTFLQIVLATKQLEQSRRTAHNINYNKVELDKKVTGEEGALSLLEVLQVKFVKRRP